MNSRIRLFVMCLLALVVGLSAQARQEQHDTIYVYQSWEAILDQWPDDMLLDPWIENTGPFETYIEMGVSTVDDMLRESTVAVSVCDSVWLVNTDWLKSNFTGDCRKMNDWVPLYFTAKVAFIQWEGFKFGFGGESPELYFIDFERARVDKIDHKFLEGLLDRYPDLLRRYVSMKDYKKTYMIQSYFLEYIERLNVDPTVPFIVE